MTRCGYTGEDGFEISVDEKHAVQLARVLLAQPEVKPCGLGTDNSSDLTLLPISEICVHSSPHFSMTYVTHVSVLLWCVTCMQAPVTLFALKRVCASMAMTLTRRPVQWRRGLCGPWVSQMQCLITLLWCTCDAQCCWRIT